MTWVIKIIYEHNDSWKTPVNIQSVLNDEMVEVISDAGFDMRVEVFKGLLSKIDGELKLERKLKNENT
jgi:hypothetical protein